MANISREALGLVVLSNYATRGILPSVPKNDCDAFVLIRAMDKNLPKHAVEQWLIECVQEDPFITARYPSMYYLACRFAGNKLSMWRRAKIRTNYWLGRPF